MDEPKVLTDNDLPRHTVSRRMTQTKNLQNKAAREFPRSFYDMNWILYIGAIF